MAKQWRLLASISRFGRISITHLYEARERFQTMKAQVDYYAKHYKVNLEDEDEVRRLEQTSQDENFRRILAVLSECHAYLENSRPLLVRKSEKLIQVWRNLSRVQILLLDHVHPPETVISQRNFCKEEAMRLSVIEEPDIREMLLWLADTQELEKIRKLVGAMIERFNTIRIGNLHSQVVYVDTYAMSLALLFIIGLLLMSFGDLILPDLLNPIHLRSLRYGWEEGIFSFLFSLLIYPYDALRGVIESNQATTSVFLGGLCGGLFSAAQRILTRERKPDEDIYSMLAIITKPFIGAFGAFFFYILVLSGLAKPELLGEVESLQKLYKPGMLTFGFGFLAGISERLIYPKIF